MICSYKIAANCRQIVYGDDPTKIESTIEKTQNVKQIMWQQTRDVKQMSNTKPQMPSKRSNSKPYMLSKRSNEPLERSRIKSLLSSLLKGSRMDYTEVPPGRFTHVQGIINMQHCIYPLHPLLLEVNVLQDMTHINTLITSALK